jgi:hypothetical protein
MLNGELGEQMAFGEGEGQEAGNKNLITKAQTRHVTREAYLVSG